MRTRRTGKVFLRASVDVGRSYVSGIAVEAVVAPLFVDLLRKRCQGISAAEQVLLEHLFLVSGIDRYTARRIAGAPYYQMLWHLDTTPDQRGECFPCHPQLVEARALTIS